MSREMFSGNLRNRLHSDEWLIWQDQYEAKENLKYVCTFQWLPRNPGKS